MEYPPSQQELRLEPADPPPVPENLSGEEVESLMRRYRMTIRRLAAKMAITQTRVREVRANGVQGKAYVQDYMEAITGKPLNAAADPDGRQRGE